MKKSKMYNFSREDVKQILDSSNTWKECLIKLGYKNYSNLPTLKKVIENYSLEIEGEELEKRSRECQMKSIKDLQRDNLLLDEEIFCKDSPHSRKTVKNRILSKNLIPYKCQFCGNEGIYNNKPLVLQLDHINGINNDNRLENLRWLCPNCHSQTETFSNRNYESLRKKSLEKEIKKAQKNLQKENLFLQRKEYFDSIDTTKFGWISKASKDLGLSHTQIRRWLNKHYPEKECFKRNS